MFFVVGGVQPQVATTTVDLPCPACGTPSTQQRRVDQVLSLFFVPLLTIREGQPYRFCPNCGWDMRTAGSNQRSDLEHTFTEDHSGLPPASSCSQCGSAVQPEFRFCPFCGTFLGPG